MRFSATKQVRRAYIAEATQRQRVAAKIDQLNKARAEVAKLRSQLEASQREQEERNADLIVRGYEPSDAELREEVAKGILEEKRLRAKESTIPVLQAQIQEARAAAAERAQVTGAAALPLLHEMTDHPLDRAREILASLADVLPVLLAADLVRERFVSRELTLPPGATPPLAGGVIVRKFLENLPKHLRPDGLEMNQLMRAARRISTAVVNEVEGKTDA